MVKKIILPLVLIVIGAGSRSMLRNAQATSGARDEEFQPVATVQSIMVGQSMAFGELNKALRKSNGKNRYEKIAIYAEIVAELSNVNVLNHKDKAYRDFAIKLRETALDLVDEADKEKDASGDAMRKIVSKMKSTCGACHAKYQ